MYEFESRVRYSEVDEEGVLKLSALVNYLQDCSTFQSEDLGVGFEYLREIDAAWVLNYWQIDLERLPKLTDHIVIGTIPYLIKGFMGLRNFYIKDAATDEMIVKANTVWTLINLNDLRPVRADSKMLEKYVIGEKLEMEYTNRKIKLEGDFSVGEEINVMKYMLDTNYHVNNEQYIEMALNYIPDGKKVRRIRTEYRESAYLGDVLVPEIYMGEDSMGVALKKKGETDSCVRCHFTW